MVYRDVYVPPKMVLVIVLQSKKAKNVVDINFFFVRIFRYVDR